MATTAAPATGTERTGMSTGRLVAGYGIVLVFMAVAIGVSISLGNDREHATPIGGIYAVQAGECLAGEVDARAVRRVRELRRRREHRRQAPPRRRRS